MPDRLLSLLLLVLSAGPGFGQSPDPRLRVLFLGDQGHHQPAARLAQIHGAFGRQGVAIDWEDRLDAIDDESLAPYDAVMVYANFAALTQPPVRFQKALNDFVRAGGGLIALHCASACFPESMEWEQLLGGRFLQHGTGVLEEEYLLPDHPLLQGATPIRSWDESYQHRHHPNRRTVLARVGDEDWTWVREHGKGRIFYTAWGHDQRTWEQPAFQDLLLRAVLWVVPEAARQRHLGFRLPELQHETRPTVQNYEQRPETPAYQFPLAPIDALAHLQTRAGLRAELFATEPDITNPIAMSWDHRGRLWVLESVDYPNRVEDDGVGRDRIVICEDRDGDGRAEHFQTFVEGLNIPTGILCVEGGVLIAQAPDLLFLHDRDGDDRSDERQLLYSGFGRGDTHAGPSNLHFGLDAWIYGVVGYAGFRGADGRGGETAFNSGLYRFRLDGSAIEFVAQFTNNSWGIGFRSDGELFGSTANNAPSFHIGAPRTDFRSLESPPAGATPIHDFYAVHPLTPVLRQVDVFGGYTAAAGHHFATGAWLPQSWSDRFAFVCEPTAHLVAMFRVDADGSGFRSHDAWNVVASSDEWFAPVQAQVGPDGALWVADWYEFIVQHNPTPTPERGGFASTTGKGNAHVNPLRDRERGRVLRVLPTEARAAPPMPTLDTLPQRFHALAHPNLFWRLQAQHLLARHPDPTLLPVLSGLVQSGGLAAVHALAVLDSWQAWHDPWGQRALRAGLHSAEASVRKSALRLLPADGAALWLEADLLNDPAPAVRRQALFTAVRFPANFAIGEEIGSLDLQVDAKDPWLPLAQRAAALAHPAGFLAGVSARLPAAAGSEIRSVPLPNADFEGDGPGPWQPRTYSGSAEHRWVAEGRGGGHCLRIDSSEGSDTSWYVDLAIEANTRYRFTGWVRTAGLEVVGERADGALFNLHTRGRTISNAILGDHDWTQLVMEFTSSPDERQVSLNCLYGGWGRCQGTAWFDDLALEVLGSTSGIEALAREAAERLAADPANAEAVRAARKADLLRGGDPQRGRTLFATHPVASCIRCHRIDGEGGEVGPDLSAVADRLDRAAILESLLDPNAVIAEGYPAAVSPMPPMRAFLSDAQLRDLVAYLASRGAR